MLGARRPGERARRQHVARRRVVRATRVAREHGRWGPVFLRCLARKTRAAGEGATTLDLGVAERAPTRPPAYSAVFGYNGKERKNCEDAGRVHHTEEDGQESCAKKVARSSKVQAETDCNEEQ